MANAPFLNEEDWQLKAQVLIEQRDAARSIACRLEQELAELGKKYAQAIETNIDLNVEVIQLENQLKKGQTNG